MPRSSDKKDKATAVEPAQSLSQQYLLRAHFAQESPKQNAGSQVSVATHVETQSMKSASDTASAHASGSSTQGESSTVTASGKKEPPTNAELDKMIICNPNWYSDEDKKLIEAYNKTKVDPFQYQVDKFSDEDTDEE